MLKTAAAARVRAGNRRFAIVAAEYNRRYVDGLLNAALAELRRAGARDVEVIRVPGSYEIPVAAAALLKRPQARPGAVLCLGVIWQGETTHAQHIGAAITDALMQLQLNTGIPCVHEVLTVLNEAQAEARCLTPKTNRGIEAARTALAMAQTLETIVTGAGLESGQV
jgi:6,7-dimethyl-8-ribityllumazine synthase